MGRTKKGRGKKKRGGGKKQSSKPVARDNDAEDRGDVLRVGTRVEVTLPECMGGAAAAPCSIGTITGRWVEVPGENVVAPFRIRLDDGRSGFLASESEDFIRKSDAPPLRAVHKMGSRVECKLGDRGEWYPGTVVATHVDWIERNSGLYVIHVDYGGTRPFWGPADCIRPSSSALTTQSSGLRFKVGDRVACSVFGEDDRKDGTIIKLWYRQRANFADDYVVPYQIQLDAGNKIFAPADRDDFIVRSTSPAPDCWICFDNEQSEDNLLVRECACRGFVHVKCLVKLAQTKVEVYDPEEDGVNPFTQCVTCQQPFDSGSCFFALAKAFHETYKHRDVYDSWNEKATVAFSRALAREGEYDKASNLLNERVSNIRLTIEGGNIAHEMVTLLRMLLARILLDLAGLYDEMGSMTKMKAALDESLSIVEDVKGFRVSRSKTVSSILRKSAKGLGELSRWKEMKLMAKYAYSTGDKDAALECLEEARNIYIANDSKSDCVYLSIQCGNLNLELGNKERGLELISQAVRTLATRYGQENKRVRTANRYVRNIEQGLMEKWPSDGLAISW